MKITDILSQKQQQQVSEAPVGMLKRAGLGIASKFGSSSAKGALDMAKYANGLRKQFDFYLGQTDQKPNSDALIAFLKSNGFPTAGAEAALKQAAMASGSAATGDIAKELGADRVEPTLIQQLQVLQEHLAMKFLLKEKRTNQLRALVNYHALLN